MRPPTVLRALPLLAAFLLLRCGLPLMALLTADVPF
jgi:hypothetical protein